MKIFEVNQTNEIPGKPIVYVDMDGVLADFFGEWSRLSGVNHYKDISHVEDALNLIRAHPSFWLDLPPLSDASPLLGAIKKYAGSYNICSTPLHDDKNSEPHKRLWVKRHLHNFPPHEVIITHNKPAYATQADGTPNILIDDYGKNIKAWEAAGGIGIKHENGSLNHTVNELRKHLSPEKKKK